MPTGTIVLLFEAGLRPAAKRIVMILGLGQRLSRPRVAVQRAVLLPAGPAPCPPTAGTDMELVVVVQAAGKDVVACIILQSPAAAPGTGLRIRGAGLSGHSFKGYVEF